MTREHKLALFVGFALVLIVCILISDHFSRARDDTPVGDLSAGQPRNFGSEADGLRIAARPGPIPSAAPAPGQSLPADPREWSSAAVHAPMELTSPRAVGETPGQPVAPSPSAAPGQSVATIPSGPFEVVMGVPADSALSPSRAMVRAEPTVTSQLLAGGATPLSQTMTDTDRGPGAMLPDPRGEAVQPSHMGAMMSPARPNLPEIDLSTVTPSAPTPIQAAQPVSTGKVTSYTVRGDDTIFEIAQRQYGDGRLWTRLRSFNSGRIGAEGQIREGAVITLPPTDVLMDRAVLPGASPSRIAPTRRADQPVEPRTPENRASPALKPPAAQAYATYTVQRGDILGEVSRKTLGTSKRWREIAELNRLADPDTLEAGLILKLPPR